MSNVRQAWLRLANTDTVLAVAEVAELCWMSDEENQHLSAMTSQARRGQFIAGHWLVRCLAAEARGGDPTNWILSTSAGGVPELKSVSEGAGERIHASISHSAEWVAAVVAPFPVGVDVEATQRSRDFLALAGHAFSREEYDELSALPDDDRNRLFYRFWTLKEANGKRQGHGLRPELSRRERAVEAAISHAEAVSWQFGDIHLALAGEAGMRVRQSGMSEMAEVRRWCFAAAPA